MLIAQRYHDLQVLASFVARWRQYVAIRRAKERNYGTWAGRRTIIIIINNSICLRHISSNKTIQRRITLYRNLDITLKLKNRDVVVK